jgi:hypothetical protein
MDEVNRRRQIHRMSYSLLKGNHMLQKFDPTSTASRLVDTLACTIPSGAKRLNPASHWNSHKIIKKLIKWTQLLLKAEAMSLSFKFFELLTMGRCRHLVDCCVVASYIVLYASLELMLLLFHSVVSPRCCWPWRSMLVEAFVPSFQAGWLLCCCFRPVAIVSPPTVCFNGICAVVAFVFSGVPYWSFMTPEHHHDPVVDTQV